MKKISLSELSILLSKKGFRLTKNRAKVFETLATHESALSLFDLELILETIDKSTIFRCLQLFQEVGALHRIDDGSGIYKFALSRDNVSHLSASHAHFYCLKCEQTYCIEGISMPVSFNLPEGFCSDSINLVIKGTCANCKKRR